MAIEILEKEGPYEFIKVGGIRFLRIEDAWRKESEYIRIDFQAASIQSALRELKKQPTNGEDAEARAMLALEACIVHKAEAGHLKPDAEQRWQRYLKLKELALRPGTPEEGWAAVKAALRSAMEVAL